jgi:hypothetical protein
MMNEKEIKIIFREGDKIRSLRGIKKTEDNIFIVIERTDGNFWINKKEIIKIEELTE